MRAGSVFQNLHYQMVLILKGITELLSSQKVMLGAEDTKMIHLLRDKGIVG